MDASRLIASVIRELPGNVAVLDAAGTILAVNGNWRRFAEGNGLPSAQPVGPGVNYLEVCQRARAAGDGIAASVEDGLRRVLAGESPDYACEYPCHSDQLQRWFHLHAMPLEGGLTGAVVCHRNITREWHVRQQLLQPAPADPQFLVVCSSCKRIHGAGERWGSFEEWLFRNYQTCVSHGLCAACTEELYPGLLNEAST